jgi:hypothetical protein
LVVDANYVRFNPKLQTPAENYPLLKYTRVGPPFCFLSENVSQVSLKLMPVRLLIGFIRAVIMIIATGQSFKKSSFLLLHNKSTNMYRLVILVKKLLFMSQKGGSE